jgi:hypothetical protein
VDWTGYEVFDPEVDRPLHEVSRAQARRHFDKLMAEKEERKAMLAALLERDGLELGDDDASISALDHWYRDRVEPDPERSNRLFPEWYSVANDMALHLGDVAISRSPWLRWELYVWGKKNASYHRPVLMGFRVPHDKYNVDLDAAVVGLGLRRVTGQAVDDEELVPLTHLLAEHAEGRF